MLIKIPPSHSLTESDITPPDIYHRRRTFLQLGAGSIVAAATIGATSIELTKAAHAAQKLAPIIDTDYKVAEPETPLDAITNYNNFYEFSLDKEEVAEKARNFKTRPWTVEVSGEVNKPMTFDIDDLLKRYPLERRIYRFRCVEAWSMVIPWVGFPLAALLKDVDPRGNAKYVEFTTLHDPKRMPNQKRDILKWPYLEGLRMDEAMHPLTLLAELRLLEGDAATAKRHLAESLKLRLAIRDRYGIANSLERLAWVAEHEQQWEHAARLLGAAEALRALIGVRLGVTDEPRFMQHKQAVLTALGPERFAVCWQTGKTLNAEAVLSKIEEGHR